MFSFNTTTYPQWNLHVCFMNPSPMENLVPSHYITLLYTVQAEELAKQQKFVESTRDIHHHMLEQMRELEEARREQTELDQQLLRQRIIQDQKVATEITVKLFLKLWG